MTNRRLDRGQFARVRKTPQGGIRVDAGLTRVGILPYRNPDGSTRREFRPPEEVFRADSLESLAGAPVLDGHSTWVTPDTWHVHARGHVVEGTPRKDGELVAADLIVQDAGTLDRVERRDLAEISCGYTCDYVPGEGTWNGQRYDGVQRNIRYNHVALLPSGSGRAGRECALRLDAAEAETRDTTPARAALVATLALQDPSFNTEGATDAYLQGRLDAINEGTVSLSREVEIAAGRAESNRWRQPSPFASPAPRTTSAQRADGNTTFTAKEVRQASHDAARNAWRH